MEIVFDDEEQNDYETEIIDGSLTFDELLKDDYYKAEFEKRVQQRLDIQNSHSDVKGGNQPMNDEVQQIKAHIAELLNNITEAIEKGDATDGGNTKGDIEIDYRPTKTHLVIGRSYKGEKATYVLTGFKRRKSKKNK